MGNCIMAILALALLSSAASAEYVAYFSPDSSAFAISSENASFQGHYGNYTVQLFVFPPPSSIVVAGKEASRAALVSEIAWLKENGVLESSCNPSGIANVTEGNGYACTAASAFVPCAAEPECSGLARQSAARQENVLDTTGGMALPLAQKATARAPAPSPGTQEIATTAYGASAPPAQTGVSLEQMVQLAGALVLVVIASYLVLQQRQIQIQIDPQEERLLENQTRTGILSQLEQADRIPTDLSLKLGKSKATIVEHLEALSAAGFVEKLATPGRKFVYYRLTRKGKQAILRRAG